MGISQAKMKANHKYDDKTYDKFTVRVRKTDMEKVREIMGDMSVNGFINIAIREKIDRESRVK